MAAQPYLSSRVVLPGGLFPGPAPNLATSHDADPDQAGRPDTAYPTVVTVHPLTGHEEDWLARSRDLPAALLTSRLIEACVVPPPSAEGQPSLAGRLLSGDRDYLVLQIRRLTLGDAVHAVASCPACRQEMDVDFDSSRIPLDGQPQTAPSYTVQLPAPGESPSRLVRFRLPRGEDQEAIAHLDLDAAAALLLTRCLLDPVGPPLTPSQVQAVSDAMELVAPALHLELELVCPVCDHAFLLPFDTTAFFFEEMRLSGRQLLNEVHALALHYHWGEAEILGLVRDRRRSYLALLHAAAGEA